MARIAENTVIVDGQEYKPGDVIPDFKSIKCVDTREPRKYQGLSADVSVLNDVIAKYASGGASCFVSDTGEYYEYDRKEKTWKLITNITERGFDAEKAYGALKHMLKNVTVSDEKIQSAVTNYLTVNPVLPGATTEQAQQIEQNKTDVASLKTETGSLKENLTQLEEAINYVKVTDMLGSISGFGYSKNVTNPQWMNNEFSCESSGDGFCAIGSFDNYYLKSGRKYIVAYESSGQCILRGMNEYVYSDTISSNIGASFPLNSFVKFEPTKDAVICVTDIPSGTISIKITVFDVTAVDESVLNAIDFMDMSISYSIVIVERATLADRATVADRANKVDTIAGAKSVNLIDETTVNGATSNIGNKLTYVNTSVDYKGSGFSFTAESGKSYYVGAIITNNADVDLPGFSRAYTGVTDSTYLGTVPSGSTIVDMVKVDGIDGKIGVVYSFYSATAISVNYTMQMFAFEDLGGSFELYKQKMFSDYVIDKSVYADIASKCFTGMEQKNICAFGDSITAQAKWYEPLKSYLGASNIYNRGIGGTCIGGSGANAMWQDVRINALEKDIDCLLIMGGTNDSAQGVTIGEISRDNLDTSTFVGAYNVLLSKVYCKYYHLGTYEGITQTTEVKPIKIMLATPIYCNDPTYGNMDNIAEAVRGIANMWGIPVADQHAKSGINAVTAELYLADNVHPNDEGGKRVANVWANALRENAELN